LTATPVCGPQATPPTATPTPTPTPTATATLTATPAGVSGQLAAYGVIYNAADPWQTGELDKLLDGVQKTGQALYLQYGGANGSDTFKRVFYTAPLASGETPKTKILFIRVLANHSSGKPLCITAYADVNGYGGDASIRAAITCYGSQAGLNFRPQTVVHELGHVLRGRTGGNVTSTTGLYGMMERPVDFQGNINSTGAIKDFNPPPQIVMGLNSGDWQRGFRGWGTSIYNAAPCDFQQNPYQIVDSSATTAQKVTEVDEAAADMFLNWVYTKIAVHYGTATPAPGGPSAYGFVDTSWGGTTNVCLTAATPQPTQRPGLTRYNYMTDIVMPRIANAWIPAPTPTP